MIVPVLPVAYSTGFLTRDRAGSRLQVCSSCEIAVTKVAPEGPDYYTSKRVHIKGTAFLGLLPALFRKQYAKTGPETRIGPSLGKGTGDQGWEYESDLLAPLGPWVLRERPVIGHKRHPPRLLNLKSGGGVPGCPFLVTVISIIKNPCGPAPGFLRFRSDDKVVTNPYPGTRVLSLGQISLNVFGYPKPECCTLDSTRGTQPLVFGEKKTV
eukprot:3861779-Rhodomonas_salina.1